MKQLTINDLALFSAIIYAKEFESMDFDNLYDWSLSYQFPIVKEKKELGNLGLIHKEQFQLIVNHIQKEKDFYQQIKIISVDRSFVEQDVLSFGLRYRNTVVVVYRGTAGSYEWYDNALGSFRETIETPMQKQAEDYFLSIYQQHKARSYYLTGHSKGANKAKYVMIKQGNLKRLKHAYCFDGQGFNALFHQTYYSEISRNASKITSIANEYDFVNILLQDLNEQKHYIQTTVDFDSNSTVAAKLLYRFGGWHSLFSILGEDLKINKVCLQSDTMKNFKSAFDYVLSRLEDEDIRFIYYNLAKQMADSDLSKFGEDYSTLPKGFLKRLLEARSNLKKEKPELLAFVQSILVMFLEEIVTIVLDKKEQLSFQSNPALMQEDIGSRLIEETLNPIQQFFDSLQLFFHSIIKRRIR